MRDSTSWADPGLKDVRHLRLRYCNFFNPFYNLNSSACLLENVSPDAGLQERATFSTLNIGLAGTGNRTRATCMASSGTIRSANHYAYQLFMIYGLRFQQPMLLQNYYSCCGVLTLKIASNIKSEFTFDCI
jgi:hypothetical protein